MQSVSETAQYQYGQYDGTIYSFDIIDRVMVEAYSLLQTDVTTIRVLSTLKRRLMNLNGEKRKLLSMSEATVGGDFVGRTANAYTAQVRQSAGEISQIVEQIERSLFEKFGIVAPKI